MEKKPKFNKKRALIYVICFIVLFLFSMGAFFLYFSRSEIVSARQEAESKMTSIDADTFRRAGATVIYDNNGNQISKLCDVDYIYANYHDIPEAMKNAFVATEDKDFYKNGGISIKGIARSVFVAIKNKGKITQGGSTITQQLVKNVLLTQNRTWLRKYTEIFISLQLEKKYSKQQILEYYINNISFSNGAYGAATAAKIYFNKTLNQLNLAEITFLAAIPNNPTYYNPLKYYSHVIDRQHLMLYNMKQQNYITEEQYDKALKTKVKLDYHPHENPPDNYMMSYAIDCAVRELMGNNGFTFRYQFTSSEDEKNYDNSYKNMYVEYDKKVRSGGYSIYTSFDEDKQKQLQASVDEGLSNFTDTDAKSRLYKMQGAAVCIDNSTGEVIAAVGGRSQESTKNYFNRAFLAVRQPGSSIKPILDYGPAFDKGYTPESIINDQYISNGPKNSEGTFYGPVSIRFAVEMSLNSAAYQLLIKEGVQYALPYLYKMDFAHIDRKDNNPIIAIGGFTNGVTPVEMAGAYSALARYGEFIQPTCVKRITEYSGKVLFDNPKSKIRIYKEKTANSITDVLKGVLTKSWATGYGLGLNNMPAAGKTGTTNDCKDGWFAGYTPYLTTVVWVGYDTPTALSSLYGATYPGHIWQNFMNKAHEGLKYKEFGRAESASN